MVVIAIITTSLGQLSPTWCVIRNILTVFRTGSWWLFMTMKGAYYPPEILTKELTTRGAIWRGQQPSMRHRFKVKDVASMQPIGLSKEPSWMLRDPVGKASKLNSRLGAPTTHNMKRRSKPIGSASATSATSRLAPSIAGAAEVLMVHRRLLWVTPTMSTRRSRHRVLIHSASVGAILVTGGSLRKSL